MFTEGDVGLEEVVFNSWEAAVDGVFWDGVAAFLDSALDSGPGFIGVGEPEEVEDDAEAVGFGLGEILCVGLAAEGGLKGEGFAFGDGLGEEGE